MPPVLTTTEPCQLHQHSHPPIPTICERHHIIPVSWQAVWTPYKTASPSIWAPETVTLCPTSHRTVHYHLPRFMRLVPEVDPNSDGDVEADDLMRYARWRYGVRRPTGDWLWAAQAVIRWRAAGGRLEDLVEAGQFGYGVAGPV